MAIPKIGRHGFEVGEQNRRRVWNYFYANPFNTARECAAALGLSEMAVSRAKATIKAGWKPEEEQAES